MMYPTLLNSQDLDAMALSVVEIRPGLCDVEDLSSQGKIALRGSERQENDLVVDADDCVDNLQGTTDDNRVQPSKPQRYNKNQHQDEETPKSGGCSSHVLPYIFNIKVLLGLFVGLLAVGHGAGADLNHRKVHKAAGSNVMLPFKCPSDYCLLKFHSFAEKRDRQICDGRECDEGYTFYEDGLSFIADYKTAGSYCLVDFDTNDVVYCIKLKVWVGHGAGACLNHTNVHMTAGSKVELPFKCPSDNCHLKFQNLTEKREKPICDGKKCDEGYTFDEDGLHFIADYKTAGNYSLVDFHRIHTNDVVYCIELTVGASERQTSRATSNALPSGLLMVLTVVLGYFIHRKLTG